jgi:hypothetical protein
LPSECALRLEVPRLGLSRTPVQLQVWHQAIDARAVAYDRLAADLLVLKHGLLLGEKVDVPARLGGRAVGDLEVVAEVVVAVEKDVS